MFRADPGRQWEALARSEPYHSVLTADEYRSASWDATARERFFQSGEDTLNRILQHVPERGERFEDALDFGCGVGRVTLALARRSRRVTAVDVAPTMLALTRAHAEEAGLPHVVTLSPEELLKGRDSFDLVTSFLVFQHIPPGRGIALLRELLARVRPGGSVALHFPYWRSGSVLAAISRWMRSRVPGVNLLANLLTGKPPGSPYMQMNVYDLNEIVHLLHDHRFESVHLLAESELDVRGVIVIGTSPGGA